MKIINYVAFSLILLTAGCFNSGQGDSNEGYFIPSTISEEAQEALRGIKRVEKSVPDFNDFEGWKDTWTYNERIHVDINNRVLKEYQPSIIDTSIMGVPVIDVRPRNWKDNGKVLIYTHGGGYTLFSARTMLMGAVPFADATGLRIISVDYKNPPFGKHPEIINQVILVVQALLKEGYKLSDIAMYGDSAGGAIASGSVLKMRDMGIGMPAAVVMLSPWSDISDIGDTYYTIRTEDPILDYEGTLRTASYAYSSPENHKNPYISPVYGDYTKGFPPTLIQGGTKEIFLSNMVRHYQALDQAGIPVKLDLYEGMWHVFQSINYELPESALARAKMNKFLKAHLQY